MINFNLEKKKLILRKTWAISRGSTDFKINFIVGAEEGGLRGLGECAFSVRYDQSIEGIEKNFNNFLAAGLNFSSLKDLGQLDSLDLAKPLRFAIESAIIHLWALEKKQSVSSFLGVTEPGEIKTSYSIPIMDPSEIKDYLQENQYSSYKLKVDQNNAKDLITEVCRNSTGRIRLDANEDFDNVDELLKFLGAIDLSQIDFLEQPFAADKHDDYEELYQNSPVPVMADESFIDERDLPAMENEFHIVNIKLMKVGSYLKTIELANELKKMKKKLMVGCMIETSVGITSAMHLGVLFDYHDLDGSLLIKNDPYDLLISDSGNLSFKN